MRRFTIQLADSDRERYGELDLRVAQHPSESERYLVARVLARCLEDGDGLEFSKGGVSDDTEPALVQRDLRGDLVAWIEIGAPTPARLHKASKASPRVAVYGWKQLQELADALVAERVHRHADIAIVELDADVLDRVAATLDRNNRWDLAVTGGAVYLTIGEALFELAPTRLAARA